MVQAEAASNLVFAPLNQWVEGSSPSGAPIFRSCTPHTYNDVSSVLLGDLAAGKWEKGKGDQCGLAVVWTFWLVLVLVPTAVARAASWRTIWEGSVTTISGFFR